VSELNFASRRIVWILFVILFSSFLVKSLHITQPFISHFGSYQSVVGMVAYQFAQNNFSNFWLPESLLLTRGMPSLEMIYFPFPAAIVAFLWKCLGGSLDVWGRLQAIVFMGIATILIFFSSRRIDGSRTALWVAFFFSVSPMSLIYGRAFLNEPMAIVLLLSSLILLIPARSTEKVPNRFVFLSGLLFSCALILRLHFIAAFPAYCLLLCSGSLKYRLRSILIFTFSVTSLAGIWFTHTYNVSLTHSNIHTTLFAQIEARQIPDELLSIPQFYLKVFGKEFVFRLLGPVAFVLSVIALFSRSCRAEKWIVLFILSVIVEVFIWPSKFYDHQFYMMSLLIPGCILAGRGAVFMVRHFRKSAFTTILCANLAFNLCLFLRPAFTSVPEESDFFDVVQFIETHSDAKDRMIASHGSSADLLYYARRYGVTLGLGADRTKLPKLFRSKTFSGLTTGELENRNNAYRDTVSWFEYLKEEHGIQYYVVVPKTDLQFEQGLKTHLDRKYELISPFSVDYAVYRLE